MYGIKSIMKKRVAPFRVKVWRNPIQQVSIIDANDKVVLHMCPYSECFAPDIAEGLNLLHASRAKGTDAKTEKKAGGGGSTLNGRNAGKLVTDFIMSKGKVFSVKKREFTLLCDFAEYVIGEAYMCADAK